MLNRGETLKLTRPERRVHRTRKTISLAYFQASLLVEHLVTTYGDAGLHKLLRAYGQGLDTDAALKAALEHRFRRSCRPASTRRLEQKFGTLRAALAAPGRTSSSPKMPLDELQTLRRRATRAATRCRWRSASALRKAGELDEAMQAFERAAALVPMATGDDSPHAQMAADRAREEGHARARSPSCTALVAVDFDNVEAAARSWPRCCARPASTDPAEAAAGLPAHRRDRSVRRRGARRARPAGAAAQRRRDARRASSGRWSRWTRSIGGGLHRSRRELLQGRQARRGARSRRWPRSRSRRATSARRTCCSSWRRRDREASAASRPLTVVAAVLLALVAGAAAARSTRSCRTRPTIASPACSGASSASSTTSRTEGTRVAAGLLRRAVVHRRARRPSRTCRAASRPRPPSRSRIRSC